MRRWLILVLCLLCLQAFSAANIQYHGLTVRNDSRTTWSVDLYGNYSGNASNLAFFPGFTNHITSTFTNYHMLSHSNGMTIFMQSPGFNEGVYSTTKSRTNWGTDNVRWPIPGVVSNHVEGLGGGIWRMRISLMSHVFSNDVITSANLTALAVVNSITGDTGIATNGLAVTNLSTAWYGDTIADGHCLNDFDKLKLTNAVHTFAFFGSHGLATNEPLDSVGLVGTGLTSGTVTTNWSYSMELWKDGHALPQGAYLVRAPITNFLNGEQVRWDFFLNPHYGDTNAVFDTRRNAYPWPLPSAFTNLIDYEDSLTDYIAVFSASGSDTTGVATNVPPELVNPAHYFLSNNKAHIASLNSNNYAGSTVYGLNATNSAGSTQTLTNTPKSLCLTISYPGTRLQFDTQTGTQNLGDRGWVNVDFRGNAQYFSGTEVNLLIDCVVSNTASGMFLTSRKVTIYRGRVPQLTQGLRPNINEDTSFHLVGVNLDGFGGTIVAKRIWGVSHPNTTGREYVLRLDYGAGQTMKPELALWAGSKFMNGKRSMFGVGDEHGITNFQMLNMLFEHATNNSISELGFLATEPGKAFKNWRVAHNTWANQRVGACYEETWTAGSFRDYMFFKRNINVEDGKKHIDFSPTDSRKTNSWAFQWQVDCPGNFSTCSSPYGGNGFDSEFIGVNGFDWPGSVAAPIGFPRWITYGGYTGSAPNNPAGNGNYGVSNSSPIAANIGAFGHFLRFDQNGNERPPELNMAGAIAGPGADYYVAKGGSDSNNGSQEMPWLTIQKAFNVMLNGDQTYISEGDYNEYATTMAHGHSSTSTNYITVSSHATNTTVVSLRQVRANHHRFNRLDGLHFTKPTDANVHVGPNLAAVRIEVGATGLVVTNCTFRDWAYAYSTNVNFVAASNAIIFPSHINLTNRGFVPGSFVYLGADSMRVYTNGNRDWKIRAVEATTAYLTNSAGDAFDVDDGTNFWAVMFSGNDNGAYPAIDFVVGSGIAGPTNATITGCNFTNIFGPAFVARGRGHVIERNYMTRLNSYEMLRVRNGLQDSMFVFNTLFDSPNIIHYDPAELNSAIFHPPGEGRYDFQVGLVHVFGFGISNNLFAWNWIQGAEQQLGLVSLQWSNNHAFRMASNVFVGVLQQMSSSMHGHQLDHNTFHEVGYDAGQPISAGGAHGEKQTNLVITANVFTHCGPLFNHVNEGWFSIVDVITPTINANYASSPEVTRFAAKNVGSGTNVLAFNGGDPGYVNPLNPIGPDGMAFTDDDGLKPLPGSILAINGLGALTPVTVVSNVPIARFVPYSPTNWFDGAGSNFSPAWKALEAGQRLQTVRPYTTPDPIGNVPATVLFDGTSSIGAMQSGSTSNYGIASYTWDFGDGYTQVVTTNGWAWHTFLRTGAFTVRLWITNSYGAWATYSNVYRILPFTNFPYRVYTVATNGSDSNNGTNAAFRTIGKAHSVVDDGDYVAVLQGVYGELPDITRNVALETNRITFIGYGAQSSGWNIRHPYYTFDGFRMDGTNVPNFGGCFFIYPDADGTRVLNNHLGPWTNKFGVVFQKGSDGQPTNSAQWCVISNNILEHISYINIQVRGQSNTIIHNTIKDGTLESDFVRGWGRGHVIVFNTVTNQGANDSGHVDMFQTFRLGATYDDYCLDILIEGNLFINSFAQICQLEKDDQSPFVESDSVGYATNLVWQNNRFINLAYAANIDMDGTRWFNNLFYRVNYQNGGHVKALGGDKGSAWGTYITNNIYYLCGNSNTAGWYQTPGTIVGITNFSIHADFNFIAGVGNVSMPEAPPNSEWGGFGNEANGINGGDPGFTNPLTYDFRPAIGSVLIDSGATLSSLFNIDTWGLERTLPWTIGPSLTSGSPPEEGGGEEGSGNSTTTISGPGAIATKPFFF